MQKDLREALAPYLKENPVPGQKPFYSVSQAGIADRALSTGQGGLTVMQECLAQDIWPERFRPNRGVFAAADQAKLLACRAAVIGAGGLGGLVILLLARFGLGGLTVCDGDVFEESNLNRQFLSSQDRLGRNKASCAAEEVARVNPYTRVEVFDFFAGPDNFAAILKGAQVALDCLDNMTARYALEEAAAASGIPYVHGAVAGLEGFVMTVAPGEPGLRGLYGPRPAEKKESAEAVLGVPTLIPAAVATLQANEAVKLLLGRRGLGRGRLLHLDLAGPGLEILSLG